LSTSQNAISINLDDLNQYSKINAQNVATDIEDLPDQLVSACWQGLKHPLPEIKGIRRAVTSSMGGSAISADLLAA
jgi:hypothetical protein